MVLPFRRDILGLLVLASAATLLATDAFTPRPFATTRTGRTTSMLAMAANEDEQTVEKRGTASADKEPEMTRAPTLNGKMVLPLKVMASGLKGHKIAAVYAILNSQYKRGSGGGWEHCEHVGVTRDLDAALESLVADHGKDTVANVRALSFSFPQQAAMEDVASQWREQVQAAGGSLSEWASPTSESDGSMSEEERKALIKAIEDTAVFDDDEDDDDEWEMDDVSLPIEAVDTAEPIVSPFSSGAETPAASGDTLAFTRENVDKVLDEVRPYLISDGGNVAVDRVDEETQNVYLILEGACGSCASSTVTMKMGIERVLKENFPDMGEVVQVEDPNAESGPTELTWEAVEAEVNRIKPAIIAMGGVVKIKSVDPIGVVELEFRGSNKLQQGLELAIQDVPFVKHVKFTM